MPCHECGASTREGAELCRDCEAESAPPGILFVCAVAGLFGVFSLLVGLSIFRIAPLLGVVAIALGLGQLAVVYGLWALRSWAWGTSLILFGLGVLVDLYRTVTDSRFHLVGVVVGVALLAYIYSKHEHYLPDPDETNRA